ncbi:AMP-dependent synthetase/ligase [Winogradskya consettensis]|uniref:Acyl-CoA synthetase n=2 Tax=Winogradskya consettensis TaxID=113560 RepID=A0A919SK43_9ACTN|nr:AMP-dependent synthetase [Actinoplanes consettensis]
MNTDDYAPYASLPEMLFHRVRATPGSRAFAVPTPDDTGLIWLTWAQTGERATRIAAGLRGLGVTTGDRVALLSSTRLEWVLADLGVNCAGAATTTVYPTTAPDDAAYIVTDSGSKIFIAENASHAAKISGAQTSVTHVVLIDGPADPAARPPQLTLADLEDRGAAALAAEPGLITDIVATIGPDDLASLIYTSGTTGRARGVELTHGGWVWQAVAQDGVGVFDPAGLQYLWLPLSHSFGKSLLSGVIHVGVPTYVDGRVDKLVDMLAVVRPTLMCAAPRIFEKVYNRAVTTAIAGGGLKAKIFHWAVATGKRKVAAQQAGKPVGALLRARYAVAEKLVFSKLQNRLGGKGIVLVSGSAPLGRDIAEFFAAAGLPVLEGYGLTESSAVSFVNRPGAFRIGTVGQPLGNLEVKTDTDGEILLRGRSIMRAYHHLPEATRDTLTDDGFLRTGDIGHVDADGYLTITDRKKDLVKTSGGKYIAPSAIENQFKAVCPYASQVLVIGQSRNFVTMLVTLDEESIVAWAGGKPYAEVVAAAETEKLIAGYVEQLNAKLNRWETVKKFAILPRDLTIDDDEITPSMKVKRKVVETNFASQIEHMYAGSVAQL